jgi:DNA-directed RNA polymerase I subunit RPA1
MQTLHQGGYRAFNRIGLTNHGSPMTQMSFETTSKFLVTSALHGVKDNMASPSSRIAMGRLISTGTGCFDMMQPLKF